MSTTTVTHAGHQTRGSILDVAYRLFSRRGVRDVGINEIIEDSGIAKATFYRHYPSKEALVLAFLAERERRWTFELVEAGSRARACDARGQLLAIFDVFDEWFTGAEFDGCSFITVLLELGPRHPVGQASIGYLATIRGMVYDRAVQAELDDPDGFARAFHILMKGSIIAAAEGDTAAARRARGMAAELITAHNR